MPHVTEMKLLTVLIHTSSVKNENRKIMNTLIIDKCSSLIEDISLFFIVNFQITDLSKDGLPRVKVFIPDSMPQATVQYDEEAMVVHVKDPSLGWVARIEVVRDTPYASQIIQVKNNRQTRLGHTELEYPHGTGIVSEHLEHECLVRNVTSHLTIYTFSCHK